jgi:hypothetical protein
MAITIALAIVLAARPALAWIRKLPSKPRQSATESS